MTPPKFNPGSIVFVTPNSPMKIIMFIYDTNDNIFYQCLYIHSNLYSSIDWAENALYTYTMKDLWRYYCDTQT